MNQNDFGLRVISEVPRCAESLLAKSHIFSKLTFCISQNVQELLHISTCSSHAFRLEHDMNLFMKGASIWIQRIFKYPQIVPWASNFSAVSPPGFSVSLLAFSSHAQELAYQMETFVDLPIIPSCPWSIQISALHNITIQSATCLQWLFRFHWLSTTNSPQMSPQATLLRSPWWWLLPPAPLPLCGSCHPAECNFYHKQVLFLFENPGAGCTKQKSFPPNT